MKPKIKRVIRTSSFCPSQWDMYDTEGTYYYVRFRWGRLTVDKGKVFGEVLFNEQISDDLDGYMQDDTMMSILSAIFDFGGAKCTIVM